MYILAFIYRDGSPREYYGGGTYVAGGEKYAVVASRKNAKCFKSKKTAENACNRLSSSCVNTGEEHLIEEVTE